MIEKICPTCGTTFSCKSKLQVYCSKKCKKKIQHQREQDKKYATKTRQYCQICGKEIDPRSKRQKVCSNECAKIYKKNYLKQYKQNNKEKLRINERKYYEAHKEEKQKRDKERYLQQAEKRKKQSKEWRLKNIDKVRQYEQSRKPQRNARLRERTRNDAEYNLNKRIRARLHHALKGHQKTERTIEILGYSTAELKEHIEQLFYGDMSWDNMNTWEIHHIIPVQEFCSSSIPTQDALKLANRLDNLIPLFIEDHIQITTIYNSTGKILTRDEIECIINVRKEGEHNR